MVLKGILLYAFLLGGSILGFCQEGKRTGFESPLEGALNLSGNFGEFRSNHFHTGLDIKTEGKEGLQIKAIGEGYVSRVRVGPFGYGNALYIDHPNGYTSVYGHLQSFSSFIDSALVAEQYARQTWELDWYPEPGSLLVSKGQVVALSGNSGSSGGPHLHFEIRETITEKPQNPLLWDFAVADHRAPIVKGIYLIPLSDTTQINSSSRPFFAKALNTTEKVQLEGAGVHTVSGVFGLGIHTIDLLDGNSNSCGVYEIRLKLDDSLIYVQRMDELDFSTNRFINAHADYAAFKKEKSSIHRTFRLPYNDLPIYKTIQNEGRIYLTDEATHNLKFEVYDIAGNSSMGSVLIRRVRREEKKELAYKQMEAELCRFDEVNALRRDSCIAYIPVGRLYDDALVHIGERPSAPGHYSNTYEIGDRLIPLQDKITIRIRAKEVEKGKEDKLVILRETGGKYAAQGGEYKLGWVTADVKEFGNYVVGFDDVPPSIKKQVFELPGNGSKGQIRFTIADNLSGIQRFEAYSDGKWVRMHWDPKRSLLWYSMKDGIITKDTKEFVLRVWDERGNMSEWEWKL